jgi:hypothetical protein
LPKVLNLANAFGLSAWAAGTHNTSPLVIITDLCQLVTLNLLQAFDHKAIRMIDHLPYFINGNRTIQKYGIPMALIHVVAWPNGSVVLP